MNLKPINQFAFRIARPLMFALAIVMTLVGLYTYFYMTITVWRDPALVLPGPAWTSTLLLDALGGLGLPAGIFAAYIHIITLGFMLTFLACGWLILLRRSQDWFGLFLALIFIGWGMAGYGIFASVPRSVAWMEVIKMYLGWLLWPGLFLIFYFFPSGHVVPRWARWFALSMGIFILYALLITYLDIEVFNVIFSVPLIISWLGVGGYSQVYRYRHARADERQQVKWVVLALIVMATLFVSMYLFQNFSGLADPQKVGPTNSLIFAMIRVLISSLAFMGIPFSMSFAMLRYRLWDVDVIIRRTLVYGVLTAALALVFFGGVTVMQRSFGALTGTSNSPVAIVISTLGIWVLFNPARKWVQDFIDRRFYRKKYNAELALKKFTELARSETDIEALKEEIMAVVQETMQPEKAGLWLREAKK